MDNLPIWAVWIATPAVGISPGLAILSTSAIARLLYGLLQLRPEVTPEANPSRRTKSRPAPQDDAERDTVLTAAVLDSRPS